MYAIRSYYVQPLEVHLRHGEALLFAVHTPDDVAAVKTHAFIQDPRRGKEHLAGLESFRQIEHAGVFGIEDGDILSALIFEDPRLGGDIAVHIP